MRQYNKYETGMKFGKLTLVKRTETPRIWECVCDCGEIVFTQISHGSRECRKCAYERLAKERITHGETDNKLGKISRLYRIWTGIKTRCNNANNHSYKEYGSRGISICDEWNSSYENFKKWALDNGYTEEFEIERIDVNGNYEPLNCKWISHVEQMKNTRRCRNITIDGHTRIFSEWLKIIGMQKSNVYKNAKNQNMSVEEYLTKKYFEREIKIE